MKRTSKLLSVVIVFTAFTLSAFAANVEKKGITLDQKAEIAGTQLKPGSYTLKWENSGTPTTNVTFYQGNKVVATAPASIVATKNKSDASFEFDTAGGTNQLKRVYFNNHVLEFGSNSGQPGS